MKDVVRMKMRTNRCSSVRTDKYVCWNRIERNCFSYNFCGFLKEEDKNGTWSGIKKEIMLDKTVFKASLMCIIANVGIPCIVVNWC